MPTSRLWCTLCSGSQQKVSCGGPSAAISQGQQLRQANDSSSWGLLWAGMTLQSNVDNASTRDLNGASAAGGWPDCPRAVPSGMYPAAEADRQMSVPESHLTLARRRNKSPVAQLVPVAVLLLNLLPLALSCLQSEHELSEACEVWQRCVTRRCTLTHVPKPPADRASSTGGTRGALGQGKAQAGPCQQGLQGWWNTSSSDWYLFYPLGNHSLRLCSTKSCRTIIWPLSSPLLVFF